LLGTTEVYSGIGADIVMESISLTTRLSRPGSSWCFYEKVIKVKADVAALLTLFSDVSIDVRW
jgi:hypothetical protein